MTLSRFISRVTPGHGPATDSGPSGLAELIEKRRAGIDRSASSPADAKMQSWRDVALAAIENGDENFAGEVVGLVEKELRLMS